MKTAQIIDLAAYRRAREQAHFDALMWPFVASVGFWEAYLAALQVFQRAERRAAIIVQVEE
jgi:hypothetical protein